MRSIVLVFVICGFAVLGCDPPDMDSDEPFEEGSAWTPGQNLRLIDVRRRELAVKEEIDEAREEMREGDREEELREGWAEIQSARRGEGPIDRWLEGLGAERGEAARAPDPTSDRW